MKSLLKFPPLENIIRVNPDIAKENIIKASRQVSEKYFFIEYIS